MKNSRTPGSAHILRFVRNIPSYSRELRDWFCWDVLGWTQCESFLMSGGNKHLGATFCQKFKGHWGKHISCDGRKWNDPK